jgi:hypothetical protein
MQECVNAGMYMRTFVYMCVYIVTCRPVSRQRPEYAHATKERVLEEVFSMYSESCPVLGNGPIYTHSDKRRDVFYMVRAKHSDTSHVFSAGSDLSLYNKSLLVARGIRELELGVQKTKENGNTTVYNGVQQNESSVVSGR